MKRKLVKLLSTKAKMFCIWGDYHLISNSENSQPLIRHEARLKLFGLIWVTVMKGNNRKNSAW